MPRIAILHMFVGFILIFLSASGGFFLGTEVAEAFIHSPDELHSWFLTLAKSAHGHTNLFGYLHVLVGMTTPYAILSPRMRLVEFIGLCSGSFAMSFLMFYRAYGEPEVSLSFMGILTGACLSLSLVAIAIRVYGIGFKLMRI